MCFHQGNISRQFSNEIVGSFLREKRRLRAQTRHLDGEHVRRGKRETSLLECYRFPPG